MNKEYKIDKETTLSRVLMLAYRQEDVDNAIQFAREKGYKLLAVKHDRTFNLETGEKEKDHWHIAIISDAKHRFRVMKLINEHQTINLFQSTQQTDAEIVDYMTHINYDDKEKYSPSEITFINYTRPEIDLLSNVSHRHSIEELKEMLFDREITTMRDVKIYCSQSAKLKQYYFDNYFRLEKFIDNETRDAIRENAETKLAEINEIIDDEELPF